MDYLPLQLNSILTTTAFMLNFPFFPPLPIHSALHISWITTTRTNTNIKRGEKRVKNSGFQVISAAPRWLFVASQSDEPAHDLALPSHTSHPCATNIQILNCPDRSATSSANPNLRNTTISFASKVLIYPVIWNCGAKIPTRGKYTLDCATP